MYDQDPYRWVRKVHRWTGTVGANELANAAEKAVHCKRETL